MTVIAEIAAPPMTFPNAKADKFRREQWAFYCMLGALLKTHRGQYVAIHDGQVVESGMDAMDVVTRAYGKVERAPIC